MSLCREFASCVRRGRGTIFPGLQYECKSCAGLNFESILESCHWISTSQGAGPNVVRSAEVLWRFPLEFYSAALALDAWYFGAPQQSQRLWHVFQKRGLTTPLVQNKYSLFKACKELGRQNTMQCKRSGQWFLYKKVKQFHICFFTDNVCTTCRSEPAPEFRTAWAWKWKSDHTSGSERLQRLLTMVQISMFRMDTFFEKELW